MPPAMLLVLASVARPVQMVAAVHGLAAVARYEQSRSATAPQPVQHAGAPEVNAQGKQRPRRTLNEHGKVKKTCTHLRLPFLNDVRARLRLLTYIPTAIVFSERCTLSVVC